MLAGYILALPEREQAQPHWQAAAAGLMQAAGMAGPFDGRYRLVGDASSVHLLV